MSKETKKFNVGDELLIKYGNGTQVVRITGVNRKTYSIERFFKTTETWKKSSNLNMEDSRIYGLNNAESLALYRAEVQARKDWDAQYDKFRHKIYRSIPIVMPGMSEDQIGEIRAQSKTVHDRAYRMTNEHFGFEDYRTYEAAAIARIKGVN